MLPAFLRRETWTGGSRGPAGTPTYSENQLCEVMTTFWFNHFNVSLTKQVCAPFVPNYERDVIRPLALANFDELLLATAKSPAMLYYLDNYNSVAEPRTRLISLPMISNWASAKNYRFGFSASCTDDKWRWHCTF